MEVLSRGKCFCIATALIAFSTDSAIAANPEQVQDLGPKKGETSVQYVGQLADAKGTEEAREHSLQLLYALSDRLALGTEVQFSYRSGPDVRDGFRPDYGSAVAVVRFSDAEEDPIGTGLWLQAGLDTDGEFATLESRFILEKKTEAWQMKGNVILRRVTTKEKKAAILDIARGPVSP